METALYKNKCIIIIILLPINVANLQACHVYLTMQEMIWQCIIVTSFVSKRKQTIQGVVRDNRFSIVRETLKL